MAKHKNFSFTEIAYLMPNARIAFLGGNSATQIPIVAYKKSAALEATKSVQMFLPGNPNAKRSVS